MTIQWEGGKNFVIKTKTLTTKIGEKNILGQMEIDSPGEYEVGGVQMEIIDGIIEVFAEGICVGHIKKGKVLTDDELQKLNGIDILLIGVGGGEFTETKVATELIGQIDPSVVIPMYNGNLDEFTKEGGAASEPKDELKISRLELSADERQVVVLNARR